MAATAGDGFRTDVGYGAADDALCRPASLRQRPGQLAHNIEPLSVAHRPRAALVIDLLLDTNVVAEPALPCPDSHVLLVTRNQSDFDGFRGLRAQSWCQPRG